jgi:hypothetical protein
LAVGPSGNYNPAMRQLRRILVSLALGAATSMLSGCVRRTIAVSSDPPGALLWLNGREIGRTPVEVDFLYYGDYDMLLVAEGYEPLLTHRDAKPPWWDNIPLDLLAETTPGQKHVRLDWHFELEPRNDDPDALLQRALDVRTRLPAAGAAPPTSAPAQPATAPAVAPPG